MKLSKDIQDKIVKLRNDLQKLQNPLFGFGALTYQKFHATHKQGKITPESTWNLNQVFTVEGTQFGLQKKIEATFKRWNLAIVKIEEEKIEESLSQQISIVNILNSLKNDDLPSAEILNIEKQVKEIPLSIKIIKDKIIGVLESVIKYPTIEGLEKSKEVKDIVQTLNATSDVNLTKDEVLKVAQDSISNRSIVENKKPISYVKYGIIGIFVVVLVLMFKFIKK